MVWAFAGDSTMTSDVVPAGSSGNSSSTTAAFFALLRAPLAAVREPAAVFRAGEALFLAVVFFAVVDFLAAISLVNSLCRRRGGGVVVAGPFHHRAQIIACNASVELQHGALDDLLQLRGIERSRTSQCQQMPPCLGGKPGPFVRPEDANRHDPSCLRPDGALRVA